jgi:hypothetical protein
MGDLGLKIVGLGKTQKIVLAALSLHIVTNKLRALMWHCHQNYHYGSCFYTATKTASFSFVTFNGAQWGGIRTRIPGPRGAPLSQVVQDVRVWPVSV